MNRIHRKFVVFSTPRSGSSHLVSLLDSHPDICCLGELFNPNGVSLRDFGLKSKKTARLVGETPIPFLLQVMDMLEARDECKGVVGFKLMLHHDPRMIDYILASTDWQIIVLERSDRIAQWTSMAMAKATGEWSLNKGSAVIMPAPKITFEPKNFEQYCFRMTAKYESLYYRLGKRDYLKLISEEIDDRYREILEFLQVDLTVIDQLSSIRERQNARSMRDRIANYDTYLKYASRHSLRVV